jgi:hypothetical protein
MVNDTTVAVEVVSVGVANTGDKRVGDDDGQRRR